VLGFGREGKRRETPKFLGEGQDHDGPRKRESILTDFFVKESHNTEDDERDSHKLVRGKVKGGQLTRLGALDNRGTSGRLLSK